MLKTGRRMVFWLLLWGLAGPSVLLAQRRIPSSYCLHPIEKQLADSINSIRIRHGKRAIPLSVSLSYVARTHVTDLLMHHPDTGICNLSSWSNKGHWKACCYNRYVVNHNWMWKKPRELTQYPYRGYEMAAYSQDSLRIDSILAMWEVSPEAMSMILTTGIWQKKSWACMGVGVNRHYISVWFGQRPDRAGRPKMCRSSHKKISKTKKAETRAVFYLIYGSYPSVSSASKVLKHVKAKGFKQAGMLKSRKHVRVYIYRSGDFDKIKNERVRWLKKYPKLWILQE